MSMALFPRWLLPVAALMPLDAGSVAPELLDLPGIQTTTPLFRAELVRLGERLSLDPSFIAAVMSLESQFNPQARNPQSKATGLIQFMPETARKLGTTVEALFEMTAVEQIPYVEKFYARYAGKLKEPGEFYMATFLPAHVGAPDDRVLSTAGNPIYDQNKGLDKDKDGVLTAGDVYAIIRNRVAAAMGRPRIPVDMSLTAIGTKSTDGEFINTGKSAVFELLASVGAIWAIGKWLK